MRLLWQWPAVRQTSSGVDGREREMDTTTENKGGHDDGMSTRDSKNGTLEKERTE